jgi:surface protein
MGTIADKLTYLQGTKSAIKAAIEDKGVTVPTGTTFRDYADKIGEITSGGADEWVRPADWLPMPTIGATEQKAVALVAVYDNSYNYLAITTVNSIIDWGDGTTTTTTGSVATYNKQYNFSDIPSSTYSTRGYRQVIVTITPISGNNLITCRFVRDTVNNKNGSSGLLDVEVSAENLTAMEYGGTNSTSFNLERVVIKKCATITSTGIFQNCRSLQVVEFPSNFKPTSTLNYFNSCFSLKKAPILDTSLATTTSNMFSTCSSLVEVPTYDLSSSTVMNAMFQNCTSLKTIPAFNTSSAANMISMFNGNTAMIEVPALNMGGVSSAANFANIIASCNLARFRGTNIKYSISFTGMRLGRPEILEIFGNLATTTGQTITVTNNPGTASLTSADLAIATGKGWTVTT